MKLQSGQHPAGEREWGAGHKQKKKVTAGLANEAFGAKADQGQRSDRTRRTRLTSPLSGTAQHALNGLAESERVIFTRDDIALGGRKASPIGGRVSWPRLSKTAHAKSICAAYLANRTGTWACATRVWVTPPNTNSTQRLRPYPPATIRLAS